jgi:hypothetical protein
LLVETGRATEAKRIVTGELRRTRFLEPRLALLEVLGETEGKLGNLKNQRRLARQLIQETPISLDYCDKALDGYVESLEHLVQ